MPIVLKLTVKKSQPLLRGIDHYWSVMMDFAMRGERFTAGDIFARSNTRRATITNFLYSLHAAGFVDRDLSGKHPTYQVLQKQSAAPKIRTDGSVIEGVCKQAAMWNALRSALRTGCTVRDLAVYASTDDNPIDQTTARNYIAHLNAGGYLQLVSAASRGNLAIWRLLPDKNTGPMHPMVLSTKLVFDQNRREIMNDIAIEEEAI